MSELRRVVARPVELDAVRFDGSLSNRQFLEAWVRDPSSGAVILVGDDKVFVPNPDGTVIGLVGDWVVKGWNGLFSVVKAADFDVLFSELPDTLEV
jgi:hypothetical protein